MKNSGKILFGTYVYKLLGTDIASQYDLTHLHDSHNRYNRDLCRNRISWGHVTESVGGRCWLLKLPTFSFLYLPHFIHFIVPLRSIYVPTNVSVYYNVMCSWIVNWWSNSHRGMILRQFTNKFPYKISKNSHKIPFEWNKAYHDIVHSGLATLFQGLYQKWINSF